MQLENNVSRDRLVTLKYEAATRWQSGLRMLRSFLALRQYLMKLKRSKARDTDAETYVPGDLNLLTDVQAADVIDMARVLELIEVVVKVLQGDQGNVAAITPKAIETLYDRLRVAATTKRVDNHSICDDAADVAAALAAALHVRMSHLWLDANYLHGAMLLDITTTTFVPDSLLNDVLDIVTTVSFQIADDTQSAKSEN
jgi:hypothetical protein